MRNASCTSDFTVCSLSVFLFCFLFLPLFVYTGKEKGTCSILVKVRSFVHTILIK